MMSQEFTVSADTMELPVQRKPSISRMMSWSRKMSLPFSSTSRSTRNFQFSLTSLSNKTKVVPKMINSDQNHNGMQNENNSEMKIVLTKEEIQQQKAIIKYLAHVPTLDWSDAPDKKDIWHTGWNPLAGINVCFKEDLSPDNEKLSIIIERQAMRNNVAFAIGCFFAKDPKTGYMALTYRVKPLHGAEHAVVYYDINYFGLSTERVMVDGSESEESKFIVSNEWQDKALRTGVNFCHPDYIDFQHVVTHINEFVQRHRRANEVSQAFQLLSLCRTNRMNNENDIIDQSHTIGPLADAMAVANQYHTIDVWPTFGESHSFSTVRSSSSLYLEGGHDLFPTSSNTCSNHHHNHNHHNHNHNHHNHNHNGDTSNHHHHQSSSCHCNHSSTGGCCLSSSSSNSSSNLTAAPVSASCTRQLSMSSDDDTSPTPGTINNTTTSWNPASPSHCSSYVSMAHGSSSPSGNRHRNSGGGGVGVGSVSVSNDISGGVMIGGGGSSDDDGVGEDAEGVCGGGGVCRRDTPPVLVEVVATLLSQS